MSENENENEGIKCPECQGMLTPVHPRYGIADCEECGARFSEEELEELKEVAHHLHQSSQKVKILVAISSGL